MVMRNANILLINFHKIINEGLKALLDHKEGFRVYSGEDRNKKEIYKRCRESEIDLIIIDSDVNIMNSVEFTKYMKKDFPDIKILALACNSNDNFIKQMFQAGASGYMLKSAGSDELFNAINTILNDSLYFSEEVTRAVMQRFVKVDDRKVKKDNPFSLTDRENEVLRHIVREFTNHEIAEKLNISVRTVESHRRNLLQKTGSRNTAGLVRYAMENNKV